MSINIKKIRKKIREYDYSKLSVKKSLMSKMICFVAVMVITIVLLAWALNKFLFPTYYEAYKVEQIKKIYNDLNYAVFKDEKELDDESKKSEYELSEIYEKKDSKTIECFSKVARLGFEEYLFEANKNGGITSCISTLIPKGPGNPQEQDVREEIQHNMMIYRLIAQVDDDNEVKIPNLTVKLIESSKDNSYDIIKYKEDSVEKLMLVGNVNNIFDKKGRIILKVDYANINENIQISNSFLAVIGIIITIAACIIMYFMSRSILRPISRLSHISERMANLDFDAKYEGQTENEIGELGKSMNFLSEQLKEKISELKRANIELQNDIDSKLESDNMRKEFLSNISHELKTPIALVQGYAEGLKDNINDDQESREFYCDVIIDESRKMNNMVKKMLDLNHLEFGDATLNIERFDIVALIRGILVSTDILFQKKDAKVIFVETEPEYVWADEFMIEEVITNYISNALNHIDGNKIVEIKLIKREDTVRVAVFNTGKNIPESDIDRIWDKFYKVDKARTREYGGSGVGLSIVKVIIELHKKTCGVINRDRGVEFWFELDTKV